MIRFMFVAFFTLGIIACSGAEPVAKTQPAASYPTTSQQAVNQTESQITVQMGAQPDSNTKKLVLPDKKIKKDEIVQLSIYVKADEWCYIDRSKNEKSVEKQMTWYGIFMNSKLQIRPVQGCPGDLAGLKFLDKVIQVNGIETSDRESVIKELRSTYKVRNVTLLIERNLTRPNIDANPPVLLPPENLTDAFMRKHDILANLYDEPFNVLDLEKDDLVRAPEFKLERLINRGTLLTNDQAVLKSSDLQDVPYLLTFWATWCPVCHRTQPVLQFLQDHSDQIDNLQVITITDESAEIANKYLNELARVPDRRLTKEDSFVESFDKINWTYDNGINTSYEVLVNGKQVRSNYKVRAYPTSFLIYNGLIYNIYSSTPDINQLLHDLSMLMKKIS